jgi:hypothetical protein
MLSDDEISYMMNDASNKRAKFSPLYTSPRDAEYKRKFIKEHGKDKDGAFRVSNRIDSKDRD